jgi:hypothetical protein
MNDVAIVDHVSAVAAFGGNLPAPQGQHQAGTEKAVQPLVIKTNPQAMANQARGHGVEHPAQYKSAAAGHGDQRLFEVGAAHRRQRVQRGLFQFDRFAVGSVLPAEALINEPAVVIQVIKIRAAPQQQGLGKGRLEMTVRPLDRAILMRHAAIVASGPHAVMRAQRLIARRQICHGLRVHVAERRRETVAAVLRRRPAQAPERVLQAARQRNKALAAEHHLGVRPAGEGEAEMVEPVRERLTGDGDPEFVGIGEVGQTLRARRMGGRTPEPLPPRPDRPCVLGGWSWRNITSCSGPCSACQARMRRSRVRRTPSGRAG